MNKFLMAMTMVVGLATTAQADPARGLGRWQGSGVVIGLDGQKQSEFTVEVTRTAVDARTVDTTGQVTLADGRTIPVSERRVGNSEAWRSESPHGKGGGRCFGGGLCQDYVSSEDGKARATTIVVDNDNQIRLLITELEDGKATRFIRQTLVKK